MGFRIVYADITQLKADAIVNPTDRFYSGGGGVDELIHAMCGKDLDRATAELPELHLGEAKATECFALPCKYIIHTSGPKWRDSHFLEISLLGSCYRNSVQLAYNLGCKSIAFPLISSRGKHFPKEQALTTAINAILECVDEYPGMDIILTIYGKWAQNIPASFFESLSDYVYDTYEPEEEPTAAPADQQNIFGETPIPEDINFDDGSYDPTQEEGGDDEEVVAAAIAEEMTSAPTMQKGTGLVVWAVKGEPSSLSICSAFPWSAVISTVPPSSRILSTTRPMHSSTVSTALTAASNTPV